MKREFRTFVLLVLASTGIAVIMESKDRRNALNESSSFDEAFGACIAKGEFGAFECVNRASFDVLGYLNEKSEWTFGRLRLERADDYARELLDLDYDPKDFRNVIRAASTLMERRSLRWNLDQLYPGLQMQIGPMLNGNGVMQFVLDNKAASFYGDRQAGTGRQLAKHLLLPFLLGFKFNLVSLIPLLFGALLLISKKALILTKVALLIGGLMGWNSFNSSPTGSPGGLVQGFGGYGHTYEGYPAGAPFYDQHHHFPYHRPYKVTPNVNFLPYDRQIVREVVNVYNENDENDQSHRDTPKGRNVVWSKND